MQTDHRSLVWHALNVTYLGQFLDLGRINKPLEKNFENLNLWLIVATISHRFNYKNAVLSKLVCSS